MKASPSAPQWETGFISPPGGQDPMPVCVYAPGYTAVFIPDDDAVGFLSVSRAVSQEVYRYRSSTGAQRAWATLSRRIARDCTGGYDQGSIGHVTLTSSRIPGPSGAPEGWGVRTSGADERYAAVQLVGDSILMVSITPDQAAVSDKAVRAAKALALTLADRWSARSTAPIEQEPLLTKAERNMLTPADVPATLPIASPAQGGWSAFLGTAPGGQPITCSLTKRARAAQQSFVSDLGSGGDMFAFFGTLSHSIDAYPDEATARRAWREVRAAVLSCNKPAADDDGGTDPATRMSSGRSGLEIQGVPGVWARTLDTYPAEPDQTCSLPGRKRGPCPTLSTKAYTITLLVGNTIQSLTYAMSHAGKGVIKVDQVAVNALAETLAQRWVAEPNTSETPGTTAIMDLFKAINTIPRCSKNEGPVSTYLLTWAETNHLQATRDAHNNVLVKVPGSAGREHEAPVALQAHMDMVCAKTADSNHDFATDPIEYVRDGDWLHANKTTLGADDGIGIAIAMHLATAPGISRPPLELVFTSDEEMDMTGAEGLSPTALTAKRYINIDWETEGSLALGSAGGIKRDIALPMTFSPLENDWDTYRLNVAGLRGGHSGLTAGKGRANANVVAATILKSLHPLRIASFDGGTADNAFAPSATVVFALPHDGTADLADAVGAAETTIRAQYPDEKNLSVTLTPAAEAATGYATAEQSDALVTMLTKIPQDVYEWSKTFPGLPEVSNNIGTVRTGDGGVVVKTFQRSFNPTKLTALSDLVDQRAREAGGSSHVRSAFPTWPPDPTSSLYKAALAASQAALGVPIKTVVVHAGLETGFIAEKYPGMEIISLGPTLVDVHTPDERLNVPSVDRVLQLMKEILRTI